MGGKAKARKRASPAEHQEQQQQEQTGSIAAKQKAVPQKEQPQQAITPCSACAEWRLKGPGRASLPSSSTSPSSCSCGPAASHHAGQPHALPTLQPLETADPQLRAFWARMPVARRRALLRVPRRELFERIRSSYCSRCFGLFNFRYDELRT